VWNSLDRWANAYKEAFLADSLSRLIHVGDSYRENSEWFNRLKFWKSKKVKFLCVVVLAKDMKPGDYMIRAYTHWNTNFPEGDQGYLPHVYNNGGRDYRPRIGNWWIEISQGTIEVNSDITLNRFFELSSEDLKLGFLDGSSIIQWGCWSFLFFHTDPMQRWYRMDQEISTWSKLWSRSQRILPETFQ